VQFNSQRHLKGALIFMQYKKDFICIVKVFIFTSPKKIGPSVETERPFSIA